MPSPLGTKCTNYFYQANINPREDEHLTPAQWREAVDTLEKNLGLTGQPRFVVEHEKEGRTHRHIVWSRIDRRAHGGDFGLAHRRHPRAHLARA